MTRTNRTIIVTLRGTTADRERLTDDARSVGLSVNQYVRYMLRLDDPNADDAEDGTGEYWKLRRQLRAARAANEAAVETAALVAGELLGIDLRLGTNRLHLEYVRKMLRRFAEANGAPPEPEQPDLSTPEIRHRPDGEWVVTTGPTAVCFGSERAAAEAIAVLQREVLELRRRLTTAEPEPPAADAPSDAVGPSDTYARFRSWIVEILGELPIRDAMAAIAAARGRSHDAVDQGTVAQLAGTIDAAYAEMMRRGRDTGEAAGFVDAWLSGIEYEVLTGWKRGAATYLDFMALDSDAESEKP